MKATILLLPIYLFNSLNVQNAQNNSNLITRTIQTNAENIVIHDSVHPGTMGATIETPNNIRVFESSNITNAIPMGSQTTTAYFLNIYNKTTKITTSELLVIQEITPYEYAIPKANYNYMEGISSQFCYWEMETGQINQMPYITNSEITLYSQLTHHGDIGLQEYYIGQDQGEEIDNTFPDTRQYGNPTKIYWYIKGTTTEQTEELEPIYLEIQSSIAYESSTIVVVEGQEVIDLPGLMLEILAMPFAFISQAFNLTLFPNTPYQVNLANTILVILGILVLFVILKIVLKIFL